MIKHWLFCVRAGLGLICLLLVLCAGTILYWRHTGREVMTVQTDSMKPILMVSDAVVVNTKLGQFAPGTILAYHNQTDPTVIVTHRLQAVLPDGQLIVKGDRLNQLDPPVNRSQVIGVAEAVLPGFGRVVTVLRSPWLLGLLVYVPAIVIVLCEVRRCLLVCDRPRYMLFKKV